MKQAAGILLYRQGEGQIEVLLGHHGGPFFAHKDNGSWTIPKGTVEPGEELLTAGVRELFEETGIKLPTKTKFLSLGSVQNNGATISIWAAEYLLPINNIVSNPTKFGWPELDRAEFFPEKVARIKIHPAQLDFIPRLLLLLKME